MTWSGLVQDQPALPDPEKFGCGCPKTPDNLTAKGRCLACSREYQRNYARDLATRYGFNATKASFHQAAERAIKVLGVSGIHGDQFERARKRRESLDGRLARRRG